MSDTPKTEAPRFNVETGSQDSMSASFGPDGTATHSVSKENVAVQFNPDGSNERIDFNYDEVEGELEKDLEADQQEGDGSDKEPEGEQPPEGEAPAFDLPDYDPENEEVAAQYASKYLSEDGNALNFEAFNKSFAESGLKDINANERAFVKKQLGVSDDAINVYLDGVRSKVEAADKAFHEAAGGKEAFDAMYSWATGEGGYTQAQKDRYNAALKAGGDELAEQIELMKVRFSASGKAPKAEEPKAEAPKQRRPASPEKTTSSTATSRTGPEPFKDMAEFQKAQREAKTPAEHKAVSARLKATPSLWKR